MLNFNMNFYKKKKLEDVNRNSANYTTISKTKPTTNTTTTSTTTTTTTTSEELECEIKDKDKKKNTKITEDINSEKENQPSVHPKLAKFHGDNLSNKERKEKARCEKITQQHEKPFPPPSIPTEVVDLTGIVQDLGSMQI